MNPTCVLYKYDSNQLTNKTYLLGKYNRFWFIVFEVFFKNFLKKFPNEINLKFCFFNYGR
jgi:hypothetical protein